MCTAMSDTVYRDRQEEASALDLVGQRIGFHLLEHGQEAVATRRRQMFSQTYAIDKVEVGIEYLFRCMVIEYPDK